MNTQIFLVLCECQLSNWDPPHYVDVLAVLLREMKVGYFPYFNRRPWNDTAAAIPSGIHNKNGLFNWERSARVAGTGIDRLGKMNQGLKMDHAASYMSSNCIFISWALLPDHKLGYLPFHFSRSISTINCGSSIDKNVSLRNIKLCLYHYCFPNDVERWYAGPGCNESGSVSTGKLVYDLYYHGFCTAAQLLVHLIAAKAMHVSRAVSRRVA